MIELELLNLLREISIGIFLGGLFFVFGTYAISHLISGFGDHGAEHEIGHDVDHVYDVGHEVEHDVDIGHEIDHDIEHDVDHDVSHEIEHEIEADVDSEIDHGYDIGHDVEFEAVSYEGVHDGYYEADRGSPMSVTVGTFLIVFGYLGWLLYNNEHVLDLLVRVGGQVFGTLLVVMFVRFTLGKVFKDTGFIMNPKDIIGQTVTSMTTITRSFGEVRAQTIMGPRRFFARPVDPTLVYPCGASLFAATADEKYVYVMVDVPVDITEVMSIVMENYTKDDEEKIFYRMMLGNTCPWCGQANEKGLVRCSHCDGSLKIHVKYKHKV
jgi:hypothetical protein